MIQHTRPTLPNWRVDPKWPDAVHLLGRETLMYVSMMPKDYHFDYLLANGLTEKAREGFAPSVHSKRALV